MKFTFDTEFIEDGKTIELISIGIINIETNEQLYLISSEFDASKADDWVKDNVLTKLDPLEPRYTREAIRSKILEFCGDKPEFYCYYSPYDWVAFCQIFGKMIDLPEGYPMLAIDLKQEILRQGITKEQLPPDPENEHNALDDAKWNVLVYKQLYNQHPDKDLQEKFKNDIASISLIPEVLHFQENVHDKILSKKENQDDLIFKYSRDI